MKAVDLWRSRLLLRRQENRGLRLVAVALYGSARALLERRD
jgi:hypothetical protein